MSVLHKSSTTPPASGPNLPLTPPSSEQKPQISVKDILHRIKDRKSGSPSVTESWQRYKISAIAYERLAEQIQEDDKLRFDYFPHTGLFILRMPSTLHEAITMSVVGNIAEQLRSRARRGSPVAEFIRDIRPVGSATVKFSDPDFGRHDPDASFRHLKAQYPGVVVEVSYSQKRKDLPRLADDYILGSNGSIRVVIGIDVAYKGKSAALTIWRPRVQYDDHGEQEIVAACTLLHKEFRNADGEANSDPAAGLRIRLEDFAPQQLVPERTVLGEDLIISPETLCSYLSDAELYDSISKEGTGVTQTVPAGVKKRRRPSTPLEQLGTDDEDQFRQQEEQAAKRSQRGDSSYRGGS